MRYISKMKAIGIDIGTTTISGVVVEVDERRHSTVIEARTIQNGSFIGTSNEDKFVITYNENLLENEAFFYFSEIFSKLNLNTPKIFKINKTCFNSK